MSCFKEGETVGIFQYESAGMQKYLKDLKPTVFADLIAMNALYRPGPLEYIPSFVDRKNGKQEISYDITSNEGISRRNLRNYCLSGTSYAFITKASWIFKG